jgi:hypothetical protein
MIRKAEGRRECHEDLLSYCLGGDTIRIFLRVDLENKMKISFKYSYNMI